MAAPLLFPYRRAWPLVLVLALALAAPSRAGDTWGLVGASLGPLRNSPRRVIADMELDHQVDGGPFGVWAALDVSTKGDYYVGTGPGVLWSPDSRWLFAAATGPGYYFRQSGFDLGYALEFRSTFYAARRLEHGNVVGTSFSHYSNSGMRNHNPGAETVRVFYAIPVPWIWR